MRCALWRASTDSYTLNLQPALLPYLIRYELLTPAQAVEHLRRRAPSKPGPPETFEGEYLPALRETLSLVYQTCPEEAMEVAIAHADREGWGCPDPMLDLLPKVAARSVPMALLYVRSMRDSWPKILGLLKIAELLPDACVDEKKELQKEALDLVYDRPRPHGFLNIIGLILGQLAPADAHELLERAIDVARNMDTASDCCRRLHELLPHLKSSLQRDAIFAEALTSALASKDSFDLDLMLDMLPKVSARAAATALTCIVEQGHRDVIGHWLLTSESTFAERWTLVQEQVRAELASQLMQEAVANATERWLQHWRTEELCLLAKFGFRDEVVAAVRATPQERQRQVGLLRLIEHLPEEECLQILGLELSRARGEEAKQLLSQLVGGLAADQRATAQQILLRAADPLVHAMGLLSLLRNADETERPQLFAQLAIADEALTDPDDRVEFAEALFHFSPSEAALNELLRQSAEQTARRGTPRAEEWLLGRLASVLIEPYRSRVLHRLIELVDRVPLHMRAMELHTLLAYRQLPAELYSQVVRRYTQTIGMSDIPEAFKFIDKDEDRRSVLQRILADAQCIHDEHSRILTAAALHPSESLCNKLIELAKQLPTDVGRFLTLMELARRLPMQREAAQAAAIREAEFLLFSENVSARSCLLHHGSEAQVRIAVQRCMEQVERGFAELAPLLSRWRDLSADEAEQASHELDYDKRRKLYNWRDLLLDVSAHLDCTQAEQVIDAIPWFWFEVIAKLLPQLPPARQTMLLSESVRRARLLLGAQRASTLALLSVHQPEAERSLTIAEVLAETGVIHRAGWSSQDNTVPVLWSVAPWLKGEHLQRVVTVICQNPSSVYVNLVGILGRVPLPLRPQLVRSIYETARAQGTPQAKALLVQMARFLEPGALADVLGWSSPSSYQQGFAELAEAVQKMDTQLVAQAFQQVREANATSYSVPHDPMIAAVGILAGELVRRDQHRRLPMLVYVEQMLRERGRKRTQLLDTISGLAPLLHALASSGVGDSLACEVLDISKHWP